MALGPMGDQATGTILDTILKHGKIPTTRIPIDKVQRAIAMFAIESFRVSPRVTGVIGTMQILAKSFVALLMMPWFVHGTLSCE